MGGLQKLFRSFALFILALQTNSVKAYKVGLHLLCHPARVVSKRLTMSSIDLLKNLSRTIRGPLSR